MMDFLKLIGKNSAEIGSQNGSRTRQLQANSRAGRLPSRPMCTNVHREALSARSIVAGERSTAWSTDWHKEVSIGHSQLTGRPCGISGRENVSPFRIQTLFLNWRRIQLGFPKFLSLVSNK